MQNAVTTTRSPSQTNTTKKNDEQQALRKELLLRILRSEALRRAKTA